MQAVNTSSLNSFAARMFPPLSAPTSPAKQPVYTANYFDSWAHATTPQTGYCAQPQEYEPRHYHLGDVEEDEFEDDSDEEADDGHGGACLNISHYARANDVTVTESAVEDVPRIIVTCPHGVDWFPWELPYNLCYCPATPPTFPPSSPVTIHLVDPKKLMPMTRDQAHKAWRKANKLEKDTTRLRDFIAAALARNKERHEGNKEKKNSAHRREPASSVDEGCAGDPFADEHAVSQQQEQDQDEEYYGVV